ncbi:MAG: transposase [Oscillospiraceae bacterium]|jgi:putative transposase|nr:transposase [Oscillospiraceae bacterium]
MKAQVSPNQLTEEETALVTQLIKGCRTSGDIQAKLKRLFAGSVEKMLEAEMDEHLGYEKHNNEGDNSGNSRNGYGRKRISSD